MLSKCHFQVAHEEEEETLWRNRRRRQSEIAAIYKMPAREREKVGNLIKRVLPGTIVVTLQYPSAKTVSGEEAEFYKMLFIRLLLQRLVVLPPEHHFAPARFLETIRI